MSEDAGVHNGHRSRMRDKFIRHGADVFETHELLEMLLYYVIPYKDTNPIAHRLLERFGSLDGVFTAAEVALCQISGIGEGVARFLRAFGQSGTDGLFLRETGESFADFVRAGCFLNSLYTEADKDQVYLLLLDNCMRFLAVEPMGTQPYSKVAQQTQHFVKRALLASAAVVITANQHTYGPLFATPDEHRADLLLKDTLRCAGIVYAEHYIINGERFVGCLSHTDTRLCQYEALEDFHRSRLSASMSPQPFDARVGPMFEDARAYLSRALARVCARDKLDTTVDALLRRFVLVRRILEADIYALMELPTVTPAIAVYIKLLAAITARRVTDAFAFGEMQSTDAIRRYFIYRMYGSDIERIYMLMLDKRGAPIGCPCVAEGAVNASNFTTRRFLELAVRADAHSVLLAHNHPGGTAVASEDDRRATQLLYHAFAAAGIRLIDHMIVAGNQCTSMASGASGGFSEPYQFNYTAPGAHTADACKTTIR